MTRYVRTVAPRLMCYSHPFDERFSFFAYSRTHHIDSYRLKLGRMHASACVSTVSEVSPPPPFPENKIQTNFRGGR